MRLSTWGEAREVENVERNTGRGTVSTWGGTVSTWGVTRDPELLLMTSWGGTGELYPLVPAMGVLKTEVPDSTWVSWLLADGVFYAVLSELVAF